MTSLPRPRTALCLLVGWTGLFTACGSTGPAQPSPAPPVRPAAQEARAAPGVRTRSGATERWALVVGIGKYDDRYVHPLYGDRDAAAFAAVLEERAGFPRDHIVLLAGQDTEDCHPGSAARGRDGGSAVDPTHPACAATRDNILQQLSRMTAQIPRTGLFVLFFSGHGKYVAGESVLLPADIKYRDDESYLKAAGVKATDIAETLHASHIKQVLVFLDACRDQVLATKGAEQDVISEQFQPGFDLTALNANVEASLEFFSSQPGAPSYEDRKEKRSYFTSELVRAFNGEGNSRDGRNLVTLGTLIRSVQTQVQARVQQDRGKDQLPKEQLGGYLALDLVLAPAR
jgi:uncharacterized caspase-like protein